MHYKRGAGKVGEVLKFTAGLGASAGVGSCAFTTAGLAEPLLDFSVVQPADNQTKLAITKAA
jgi:hypothetical protein